jgi:hypothetical protein
MNTQKLHVAMAISLVFGSALLLAIQPLSPSAVRPAQAGPTLTPAAGVVAGDEWETGTPDRGSVYYQAIEDVLPLMRSLRARGDTVRLAQLARSVLEVWSELESQRPEAMPDEGLRQEIEAWAGRGLATSDRQEQTDRSGS